MTAERLNNARPLSTMIAWSTCWQLVGILIGAALAGLLFGGPLASLAGCCVGQATAGLLCLRWYNGRRKRWTTLTFTSSR